MKPNVVSKNYLGVTSFSEPVIIVFIGILWLLSGTMWAWTVAIGCAIGSVIGVFAKKSTDSGVREFLYGLSQTFYGCALFMGVIGFVATNAQNWLS